MTRLHVLSAEFYIYETLCVCVCVCLEIFDFEMSLFAYELFTA
jgi:hypothetical protein